MRTSVIIITAAAWGMFASPASGAPNDEVVERVNASSCEPQLRDDRTIVELSPSGWTFVAGEVGQVVLECPIFSPFRDEVNLTRRFVEMRMWYRDTGGTSQLAEVGAELLYRGPYDSTASGVPGVNVSSNSSASTNFTSVAYSISPNHSMDDRQYWVQVTMTRSDSSQNVTFRAVTFREAP